MEEFYLGGKKKLIKLSGFSPFVMMMKTAPKNFSGELFNKISIERVKKIEYFMTL